MSRTSHTYRTIVDGPCWESLRESPLVIDSKDDDSQAAAAIASSSVGSLSIVLGTLESTKEKVIGLVASPKEDDDDKETTETLTSGQVVWKASVARIPAGTAADEAAATYHTGLTHLYPLTVAQAPAVGGSAETYLGVAVPQQAVILGGNPEAVWAAQALATLGSKVTLVSSNQPSATKGVTTLSPDSDDAFVSVVGEFEALLDTVGREGRLSRAVELLATRHGCKKYRSTRTKAEEIVGSEGLLWGPGKAKDYIKSLSRNKAASVSTPTLPVAGWGALMEQLLKAKVLAPTNSLEVVNKADKATTWVRAWSLKATWEANTWPSNTDGTRYGFPTLDDDDEDDEDEFTAIGQDGSSSRLDEDAQSESGTGTRSRMQPSSISPYILSVYGTEGLEKDVRKEELDCILFMSAPFCRTCKKLQAPYARLARLNYEDDDSEVVFAKADIIGKFGKELGKELDVNAVPAFVLFRKGERFGKALNVSRLPHPQLDLALQYLKERQEWDDSKFDTGDSKGPRTRI